MNKAEFTASVKAKCPDTLKTDAAAKRAVDAVLDTIMEAVASGEGVRLVGFGSIQVVHRNARTGRNPQTNETMEIKAKNVVKFKPSDAMEEAAAKAKIKK